VGKSQCYYLSNSNISFKTIKKLISNTPHDIVYINGVFSFYFSILPLFFLRKENCILNPHGMLSDQAFSVKSFKKKIFLKIANSFGIFKNVVFHVSNQEEASAVEKQIKAFKAIEIANQFPRKIEHNFEVKQKKQSPIQFVNIARISIEKGTLVLIKTLKHLDQPLNLDLYGPVYDANYWDICQVEISQLPEHIKVTYKGFLASEKILETMSHYDFFVLLSEGENFGHAILEAMSVGLPVLISNKTPWRHLESKAIGWDVEIKNPIDIIRAFNKSINMSNEDYKKWSESAFNFAKEFTLNPKLLEQNKALFLNAISS